MRRILFYTINFALVLLVGVIYFPAPQSLSLADIELNKGGSLHSQSGRASLDWNDLRGLDYNTGQASSRVSSQNGRPVRVPGFMVPLEDDAAFTTEFLLVPYPQACIHVPAPPPNQIVHVKMNNNRRSRVYWWEPVWVYGTLHIRNTESIYATSSYQMDGEKVEIYQNVENYSY